MVSGMSYDTCSKEANFSRSLDAGALSGVGALATLLDAGRSNDGAARSLPKQRRPASAGPCGRPRADASSFPLSARSTGSRTPQQACRQRPRTAQDKKEALALFAKEIDDGLRDLRDEGQQRRKAAEATQRRNRHSLTGKPWMNGGACAGTVRSASLSRTRGGTTSGLFSDVQPLEASESAAAVRERQQLERKRTESAPIAGPWVSGGACAGTVRSASLSRTRGGTTSGLFSDFQPLEGSESAAAVRERMAETRNNEPVQKGRTVVDKLHKGQHWKSGGACAGTVRAPSLSRTHGTTCSGLFSDVQPLEGSESLASLQEKMGLVRQRQRKQRVAGAERRAQCYTGEPGASNRGRMARSASQPNLSRGREIIQEGDSEAQPPDEASILPHLREEFLDRCSEDIALDKTCAGSSFAMVRAAHCGGA